MRKRIWIWLLAVGVVGFIWTTEQKNKCCIIQRKQTFPGTLTETIEVQTGVSYLVTAWGIDEETGLQQWASMEGNLKVSDRDQQTLFQKKFVATKSSGEETGSIRRAQTGAQFRYVAQHNDTITAVAQLIDGDTLELAVYKNLSDHANLLPGLFIIVSMISTVLFLRNRKTANT